MRITFFGASQQVTGSKHLVESNGFKLLLDCGLYQGKRQEAYELNKQLPFPARDIDAVILSHAHADHCGLLPVLVKNGYANKIFATPPTVDIARLMLLDSAEIQHEDYEHVKKRHAKGQPLFPPLYTADEVESACVRFERVAYSRETPGWHSLNEDIQFKLYDAGHILGSAVTVVRCAEGITLAYTGDLGNTNVPILREPEVIAEPVDTLIMECTYGNKNHGPVSDVVMFIKNLVQEAVEKKRKVIVPAFSLGRTQELVYILHKLHDTGEIPAIPVYIGSPLSTDITDVFAEHQKDFDQETQKDFLDRNESPFAYRNLHYVRNARESEELRALPGPLMVIAASGMAEGGRILQHLAYAVGDPNAVVLLTGYQAEHTLGRKLLEGVTPIRIYTDFYDVKAKILSVDELSAHADQDGLVLYVSRMKGLRRVFLVHGEMPQANALKDSLREKFPDLDIVIPFPGQTIEVS